MAENDKNQMIAEFERNRQQLLAISAQKQQLQTHLNSIDSALEELKNSKQKTAFKAAGPILVEKTITEINKELKEAKKTTELRLKALKSQEDSLIKKMNKIRAELEKSETGEK